jgi:hypothetical protein
LELISKFFLLFQNSLDTFVKTFVNDTDRGNKVDSSIYFATFAIVLLAFILQGLRIWISQLRQEWFITMSFLSEKRSWNEEKHNSVREDLLIWFDEVAIRIKYIDRLLFGPLYISLVLTLFILALLHFISNFYCWLTLIFSLIIGGSAVIFIIAIYLLMVKNVIEDHGGVESSLRWLQKEAVEAMQGEGKEEIIDVLSD